MATERRCIHPRNQLNELTGKEWIRFTKSWFVCDSRRYHRNRSTELHPARFPEEMVGDFVSFFTKPGEWVLDPFAGTGAALVSCRELGRNAVGVELVPRYADTARRRLGGATAAGHAALPPGSSTPAPSRQDVICADSTQLSSERLREQLCQCGVPGEDGAPWFDFIITSPPYWNMLQTSRGGVLSTHKQRAAKGLDTRYSHLPEDLGNTGSYELFIEKVGAVFDQCHALLRPGRYLVVIAQNVRAPDGCVKPLAWDLGRRISETFTFYGEKIWCQDSKKLGIWGYPSVFVPNYHHHYCLIFHKEAAERDGERP